MEPTAADRSTADAHANRRFFDFLCKGGIGITENNLPISEAGAGPARNKAEMQAAIDLYFGEYLQSSGDIADIESLAEYLGTTRDGLLELMDDAELGATLRRARNRIAMIKKQLAFNGKIPASVLSFDLKNNHGYRDKPDDPEERGSEKLVITGKAVDWAK